MSLFFSSKARRKKRKISFIYTYIYMYAYGEVVDRTVVRTCALACPLLDRSTSYYYVKLSPCLSAGTGKQITTAREISVHGTRQSPILATTYLSACHRFVITVDTVFSIPAAANTCRCSRAIPIGRSTPADSRDRRRETSDRDRERRKIGNESTISPLERAGEKNRSRGD